MKRLAVIIVVLFAHKAVVAQQYQPTWESIDARPVPQWFRDAKFGIFIHWGVYSVPGWSSKGQYAEWYQYGLETNDTARKKFHQKKFGDRTYYDLANDFKAELFNPDEWARLFERSGAKYIVLTSKHHDGFALWPSKEANNTWGFKWNAVDIGPNRDLLGDLFKAVRKTSVRAGMYYSLYEWFNPLWKSDPKKFATEHTWPQMKDLINSYQPDVFWTDGDWDAPAETWRSQQFLAWLFNESPVKDKVVVNDRWGSGVRFNHGGIYTPEYQPDLDFETHYFEESRGMGHSYGYNREEDAWDYNSTASLILQLVDKVSRGGNFLLDIGPDEHGKIPPIMQERLLQMGEWLEIYGEAIYGSSRWKHSSQLAADSKTKELYFTYNQLNNTLYAIFPVYPENRKLVLKNIMLPAGTVIEFLSLKQPLTWRQDGNSVIVELPEYHPNKIRAPYAYVARIGNYGKFARKPQIKAAYPNNSLAPEITIEAGPGATIYYTTDGSEPTPGSVPYRAPFTVPATATVRAKAFGDNLLPSVTAEQRVVKYDWMPAIKIKPRTGIAYSYYEPSGRINISSIQTAAVVKSGVVNNISVREKSRQDKFAFVFQGYIRIDKDGLYHFFTNSDDGSKLFIGDEEVVDNDGDHGNVEKSGKAFLRKGYHKLRVVYFDSGGGNDLKVSIQPEGGSKIEIPASMLYH
ncbi:MAG TPA: alpha-L-fucosidase [Chitinophagaceae bacterium]|nr:alpha-L-fucosidase [Chitinophagaceae bacterium]